jgi:NAD+ synthase
MSDVQEQIVNGIQRYFRKAHKTRAVIGVSGGVDSSLTLKLAVDALGAENVIAVIMPELGITDKENINHAKGLCDFLEVEYYYLPINSFVQEFRHVPWHGNKIAAMNIKARIRMLMLFHYANSFNALVLGTSNRSEILLGYGTKYGDLAADIEVIGSLLKTEVIKLARQVGLPDEIVEKTPSAELAPGQTDEDDLGASYKDLDKVLAKVEFGEDGCIKRGLKAQLVHDVFKRIANNKHKSTMPYVIKAVSSRA